MDDLVPEWNEREVANYFAKAGERFQQAALQKKELFVPLGGSCSGALNTPEMKRSIEDLMATEMDERQTIRRALSLVGA